MILLNRNNNAAILLAGICSLVVGVGVARFVFTSLLPPMLEDFLSISFAGILASVNYMGYLSGAIFSIFIKDIYSKVKYFRFGLFLCIFTSLLLGVSEHPLIWLIARLVAGFGAAMALVVGSAIVMSKLTGINKTKAMGVHFSGLGFSILITDLIVRWVFNQGENWQVAWLVLSVFGTVIALYSGFILSFDKQAHQEVTKHKFDKSLFSPFIIILILAYFAEGVGMVVQATFLPDIVNSLPGLSGYGSLTWLVVGIAGIPSCIIWMQLANRHGSVNIIMIAMLLQVIGVLIPTLTTNIYWNVFSGILYGGTFVGLVALFMNYGGQLAGKNPVLIMGAMTSAYGIGQIIAPLYCVALIDKFHNYDMALVITAIIVFSGVLILAYAKANLTVGNSQVR